MRSFTILKVDKKEGGKVQYEGGRYTGEIPANVAKKMFSQCNKHCRTKCGSMVITMKETTQNSNKKEYKYRVSRKKQDTTIVRNGVEIHYSFVTKVKSLN